MRARNATAPPAAANHTSTGATPTVSASPADTLPAAGIKFNKPYGNIGKDAGIQIGGAAWKLVEEVALVEGLGVDPVGVRLYPRQIQGDLGTWGSFGVSNVNDPAAVGKAGYVKVSLEYLHAARTQGVRIVGGGLNNTGREKPGSHAHVQFLAPIPGAIV